MISHHTEAVSTKRVYACFSAALTLPIIVWPLIYHLTPFLEGYFFFSWIAFAGIVLLVAVVADSMVSGVASMQNAVVLLAWVVVVLLSVAVALNFWNGIYLVAIMWFFHSLRSCGNLWFGRGQWWSWMAWARDCLIAFTLFLWQPFLSIS